MRPCTFRWNDVGEDPGSDEWCCTLPFGHVGDHIAGDANIGEIFSICRNTEPSQRPLRVIIESPYAGPTTAAVAQNAAYARHCLRDSLRRGEAPFASHLLYTQVLDDRNPEEQRLGIAAGLTWTAAADLVAVYIDRGVSVGMEAGIEAARRAGVRVEERRIGK